MCEFCKDMRNTDDVAPTDLRAAKVGEMAGREMYVVLGKNCYKHGNTGRYQIFTEFRIEGRDLDIVASMNINFCPMCGRKLTETEKKPMQYNEIYNICQPVMDWLKEHYPNNHKIVIDTNGAEMIECAKLNVLDKDLKLPLFQNFCAPKDKEREMQEILNTNTGEMKDDIQRFGVEMLQKLFNCENEEEQ